MKKPCSWSQVSDSPCIESFFAVEERNAVVVILKDPFVLSHNYRNKLICYWTSPLYRISYETSLLMCRKTNIYIGITAFHMQEALNSLQSQWHLIESLSPSTITA